MRQKTALAGLIGLMARTTLADGHRVQGHPTVISADTLIVQDQLTYLYQINAREMGQTCGWLNKVIVYGKVSWTELLDLIASQTPWQSKAPR